MNRLGIKIIEDARLVTPGPPKTVNRSWKERLFSLPWRPWIRTNVIIEKIPMKDAFIIGDVYIMHPETAKELRKKLEKKGD